MRLFGAPSPSFGGAREGTYGRTPAPAKKQGPDCYCLFHTLRATSSPDGDKIISGPSPRRAAICKPRAVFREDALLTTSADLAHVRDIGAAASATRQSRLGVRQQVWLAVLLI